MDPFRTSVVIQLLIIIFLLFVNGLFSAVEMAFVALNQQEMQELAQQGDQKAQRVLNLLQNPERLLSTIQVGITLSGFLASALVAVDLAPWVIMAFPQVPLIQPLTLFLLTAVLTFLSFVFGDLFPKRIALQMPERVALSLSGLVNICQWLLHPFVVLASSMTRLLQRLAPIEFKTKSETFTRSEMKALLDSSRTKGAIDSEELVMLQGVLSLDSKLAREVMTPRTDAEMIDLNDDWTTNLDLLLESPYSRIPIYREDKDNVIGVILIKSLLRQIAKHGTEELDLLSLAQEPMFVPATIFIDDLLLEFREQQQHLAILMDEYGGMEGIVTLEDLLEEIVGEIEDETDIATQEEITRIDEAHYLVNGSTPLDKFNDFFQTDFYSEDVDTIAGYIIQCIGYMPEDHAHVSLRLGDWVIETSQIEGGRIRTLQLIADPTHSIDLPEDKTKPDSSLN